MSGAFEEFSLIASIEKQFRGSVPKGILGIGDDCAVVPMSAEKSMLLSTDMLCQGVHFLRDIAPFDLGVRAVQVNLSDVAAMGGAPTAILLSISLPQWVDRGWIEEFINGVDSCKVPLIGGDTTSGKDLLTISITVIGEATNSNIKYRSGARVGDKILCTGELGYSAHKNYSTPIYAQLSEGEWLGGRVEVTAMMDISDGVAGDVKHIMHSSGVGATLHIEQIPIASGATLHNALCGGEDYKLLLCATDSMVEALKDDFLAHFSTPLYELGEVTQGSELMFFNGGHPAHIDARGFEHFVTK